jgi:hypothetical protein
MRERPGGGGCSEGDRSWGRVEKLFKPKEAPPQELGEDIGTQRNSDKADRNSPQVKKSMVVAAEMWLSPTMR